MQIWVIQSLGYSWWISINDSLITNSLLAGTCVLLTNNLQYYLPKKERYWYLAVLSFVFSFLWWIACKYAVPAVLSGETEYLIFLKKSFPVRFCIAFLMVACMAMISILYSAFEQQKASTERKTEAEQMTKDAELYKLRQQLQPHFLFNSLNSINALIGSRPNEARNMVQQLSEFLRGTLKREDNQWVTLQEEMQHLQLYLEIEKVRFGNRLSTELMVDPECLDAKIPAMLLQPLVENAIKFGLYDTIGETKIFLSARFENGMLNINVENPFDPETAQPKTGTGFGLASITRRLFLLFSRHDLLKTSAKENTFTTTVNIPQ
ncbi:MAG: histidine kinase [Gemmatimonadaceae bacterium]|nr:histidine kinase [Chitinophagaceae bacterium]